MFFFFNSDAFKAKEARCLMKKQKNVLILFMSVIRLYQNKMQHAVQYVGLLNKYDNIWWNILDTFFKHEQAQTWL